MSLASVQPDGAGLSEARPVLSIVVPALDEADNVGPLVEQVEQAMRDAAVDAELIVVDDGSRDQTLARLQALQQGRPWLRVLHRDRPQGQSAAMHAGIQLARGEYVATLDADLQNDPADLPLMLARLRETDADMVQGDRSANRRDHAIRRIGSRIGRGARRWLLGDGVRDTGCSARVLRADLARQFPLQFRGMHRFLPAYAGMLGARVIEMPVHHRQRHSGKTKYGMGLLSRGPAGLVDCFAVRWMAARYRDPLATLPANGDSGSDSDAAGDDRHTGDGRDRRDGDDRS
ncbi:glycosyltransferase family 2 protein [Phycisphaerales bacterium AB-hyl4]|uniref:Glycosyltransferase family 2 protein n=1 Tax=Natronomicrosphaera hydrolytica TaxID=3242702 RepID=A0ABV4UA69_9BACT